MVVGLHAGVGLTSVAASGANATGGGPWLDAELGLSVAPWLALTAFGGYAHDSANFNGLTMDVTFTHSVAGVRAQYVVTPLAWVGGGLAYVHESSTFEGTLADGLVGQETESKNSPAFELRAGLDATHVGRLRFQIVVAGLVFLPDAGNKVSTIATLSVGAQFR